MKIVVRRHPAIVPETGSNRVLRTRPKTVPEHRARDGGTNPGDAVRIEPMELELASSDLTGFSQALAETVEEIIEHWKEANVRPVGDESDPEVLSNAFQELLQVLRQYEDTGLEGTKSPARGPELSELGDYGLSMLLDLERIASGLRLTAIGDRLERLSVNLALWIVRRDGDLSTLELIVNGVAKTANQLRTPNELERLFSVIDEIVQALNPGLQQEVSSTSGDSAQNPRNLLLMNRAIVATRALAPSLMENAFSDILQQMPEIAPGFFTEAVEQIEPRGYPPPVAAVITRFYQLAAVPKTLH